MSGQAGIDRFELAVRMLVGLLREHWHLQETGTDEAHTDRLAVDFLRNELQPAAETGREA